MESIDPEDRLRNVKLMTDAKL